MMKDVPGWQPKQNVYKGHEYSLSFWTLIDVRYVPPNYVLGLGTPTKTQKRGWFGQKKKKDDESE